jgi:hypothetical protein
MAVAPFAPMGSRGPGPQLLELPRERRPHVVGFPGGGLSLERGKHRLREPTRCIAGEESGLVLDALEELVTSNLEWLTAGPIAEGPHLFERSGELGGDLLGFVPGERSRSARSTTAVTCFDFSIPSLFIRSRTIR